MTTLIILSISCLSQVLAIFYMKKIILILNGNASILHGVISIFTGHFPLLALTGTLYISSFVCLMIVLQKTTMTQFFPIYLGALIVVGIAFGSLVNHEAVTLWQLAGSAMIIGGIFVISMV